MCGATRTTLPARSALHRETRARCAAHRHDCARRDGRAAALRRSTRAASVASLLHSSPARPRPRGRPTRTSAWPRSTSLAHIDIPKSTSHDAAPPRAFAASRPSLCVDKKGQISRCHARGPCAAKVTAVLASAALATLPHRVGIKISDGVAFAQPHASSRSEHVGTLTLNGNQIFVARIGV
jgi:hypothetical protein